jgi:hypothetical protein
MRRGGWKGEGRGRKEKKKAAKKGLTPIQDSGFLPEGKKHQWRKDTLLKYYNMLFLVWVQSTEVFNIVL